MKTAHLTGRYLPLIFVWDNMIVLLVISHELPLSNGEYSKTVLSVVYVHVICLYFAPCHSGESSLFIMLCCYTTAPCK